jgi:hypothetical protein
MSPVVTILVSIVTAVLAVEIIGWTAQIARWIVVASVARLPPQVRDRYREEWLGELAAMDGRPIWGLIWALSEPARGARQLRRELRGAGAFRASMALIELPPDVVLPECVVELGYPFTNDIKTDVRLLCEVVHDESKTGQALAVFGPKLILADITPREVGVVLAELARINAGHPGYDPALCVIRLSRRVRRRMPVAI